MTTTGKASQSACSRVQEKFLGVSHPLEERVVLGRDTLEKMGQELAEFSLLAVEGNLQKKILSRIVKWDGPAKTT